MKSPQTPSLDPERVLRSLLALDPTQDPDPMPVRIANRLDQFGDLGKLLLATEEEWRAVPGIGKRAI